MKILGIIPARYDSSRLPGKPLKMIGDKSMIQRVYIQAQATESIDQVVVATDDERIFKHVQSFGGLVMMTDQKHKSGTSRCIEVAEQYPDYDIYINIQGDEPFIKPSQIDALFPPFAQNPSIHIVTLAKKISDYKSLHNPNVVKVVFGQQKQAMYFSRQTIPYLRNVDPEQWLAFQNFYKHIGLYAFRKETLLHIKNLDQGVYYQSEKLEQLQWLENGLAIQIVITEEEAFGIDTLEDLKNAIQHLNVKGD